MACSVFISSTIKYNETSSTLNGAFIKKIELTVMPRCLLMHSAGGAES